MNKLADLCLSRFTIDVMRLFRSVLDNKNLVADEEFICGERLSGSDRLGQN